MRRLAKGVDNILRSRRFLLSNYAKFTHTHKSSVLPYWESDVPRFCSQPACLELYRVREQEPARHAVVALRGQVLDKLPRSRFLGTSARRQRHVPCTEASRPVNLRTQ